MLSQKWDDVSKTQAHALVQDAWDEMGHSIRARGYWVWLRTLPYPDQTPGGVYLPPKLANFHGELPHKVTVRAVVLSAGSAGVAAEFETGDLVEFQRLHFAFWRKLDHDTQEYVGWIDANQILWKVDHAEEADARDQRSHERAARAAG